MTRKDYELIARCIRAARYNYPEPQKAGQADARRDGLMDAVVELSRELKRDNPNFNPERFIDACFTR